MYCRAAGTIFSIYRLIRNYENSSLYYINLITDRVDHGCFCVQGGIIHSYLFYGGCYSWDAGINDVPKDAHSCPLLSKGRIFIKDRTIGPV